MLNVILLGITSLLTDFSSEMVVPVLPFFIQSVGGAGIAIGLVFGIGDAIAALLRVFSGYWADKTGKYKLFVFAGYLFSSLAKFGYVGAGAWQSVAAVRSIERLGKGFRDAPRDAIVSESVPEFRRGLAFGIQRAMDSTGALLGAVAVLVLFVILEFSFRKLFLISAIVGLLAVAPTLFVVVPRGLCLNHRKKVSFSRLSPQARRFILMATLFALANFSAAFFILQASAILQNHAQHALPLTLVAYIAFNLTDALASGPAGALSDRWGRKPTIIIGYSLFALVCTGFAGMTLFQSGGSGVFPMVLVLFVFYGFFKAFIDAAQRAFVADLSSDEIRGTALGTFEAFTGLAAIPSGVIAGTLWNFNPVGMFVFGAVAAIAAAVGLKYFVRD